VVKKKTMKTKIQKFASRFILLASLFLLCSLITVHCSLNAQQVIYVDASNNSGVEDGTQDHPFNTIFEGINASQDSDSISVAAGTYPEDTLLIAKCVSIAGAGRTSTIVNGTFVLSSKLDTLPVSISSLWCRNVMHSDSGYTQTPLTIQEAGLQTLTDETPSVYETGRIIIKNNVVADSIHILSATCHAKQEIINCVLGSGLLVSSASSQGKILVFGNQVGGMLSIQTISQRDTVIVTNNTVQDSLLVESVASGPGIINGNIIGSGVLISAVSYEGFTFRDNQVSNGKLYETSVALGESYISNNTFANGGIEVVAHSAQLIIDSNVIISEGLESAIKLKTIAGGYLENNTITLPYSQASGLPFEEDTISVCGINVQSVSFAGMKGNKITGGAYGVYLTAIASHYFDKNEIQDSHYGFYLNSVSAYVDSNRVEQCVADGMILDYPSEDYDTNAIYLNHNIIRNNGGHGIWTKGNCLMGNLSEPGTGYNVIKDNGSYDLYVETPTLFVDTIWAQYNQWTHNTEDEVGQFDIYDAADDPSKALVMYKPLLPFGIDESPADFFEVFPNPTHGKLQITSTKIQTNYKFQNTKNKIEVVDLYGKVVEFNHNRTIEQWNNGTIELDIRQLPPGIYFIRIKFENQLIVKKIIKI